MRTHACACLLAAAALLAPAGAVAQSALRQLEGACRDATGADCRVDVPAPSPPSPSQGSQGGQGIQQGEPVRSTRPNQATPRKVAQPAQRAAPRAPPRKTTDQLFKEQLAAGLAQGFLSLLLAPPEPPAQAVRGPTPEELAERERLRVEELQRRAALVADQRAARSSQQSSNMESMASALGASFERPAAAGGSDPVHLTGTTPSLFAPPVYRSPAQAEASSPAVKRLAAFAAESEDNAALLGRFTEHSSRLDAAIAEADATGRMGRNRVAEYEQMERTVARSSRSCTASGRSTGSSGATRSAGPASTGSSGRSSPR